MYRVALTGNIASGKSTVAAAWAESGVPVVSADLLARQVVEPGTPGLAAVRSAFGEAIMGPDGMLDRAALRSVVFRDDEARRRLEAILHPLIDGLRDIWLEARRVDGASLVVCEVPLLFETGTERDFDHTVFVDAPDAERLRRLVEVRRMDPDEAGYVMAAQMPADVKRSRAHSVLANSGSLDDLKRDSALLLKELRAKSTAAPLRIDLHLHTAGSWDCLSDPEAVLARALEMGLGRIAITDHNKLHVALRMAEAHPEHIIPGEEVKTAEGIDVIGLYLSEEIPKGTPARRTIELIREQGGIPYLPHPYASGKGGGGALADVLAPLCDVVEVFNARLHSPRPQQLAEGLAERHGRLCGAGSDAHTVGEVGTTYVEVPTHPNRPDALLAALRTGSTTGRSSSHLVHLASTWAKIRKKLPGAPTG
jgi:dephospho-CoA kinase